MNGKQKEKLLNMYRMDIYLNIILFRTPNKMRLYNLEFCVGVLCASDKFLTFQLCIIISKSMY